MNKSEQINELALALNKAQGSMGGAVKDASNPYFKSRYADLASVISACKEELSNNGLAILQPVSSNENGIYVETLITHSSGQWISSGPMKLLLSKQDMQGLGSAISYARRYSLQAMLNIPAVDDDAEAAMFRNGTIEEPLKMPVAKAFVNTPNSTQDSLNSNDLNNNVVFTDNTMGIEPDAILEDSGEKISDEAGLKMMESLLASGKTKEDLKNFIKNEFGLKMLSGIRTKHMKVINDFIKRA